MSAGTRKTEREREAQLHKSHQHCHKPKLVKLVICAFVLTSRLEQKNTVHIYLKMCLILIEQVTNIVSLGHV